MGFASVLALGVAFGVCVVAGASPNWVAPVRLSGDGIALQPSLAVSSAGDAFTVWDREVGDVCPTQPENPACVHIVEAAVRAPGASAWSPSVEIARPGVGSRPVGSVGPAGDGIVLWVHDIGENRVLQASYRRGRTGAWPEPTDISDVTGRIGPHAAAVDAEGNATVVWSGTDGVRSVVYAKYRSVVSGVWGGPITLSRRDADAAGGPSLATDSSGDAVATWLLSTPSGAVVEASQRSASSASWSSPVQLSAPGAEQQASVAMNEEGDAIVVWRQVEGLAASFRPAGGAWGAPAAFGEPGAADAAVQLDAGENAVAVWQVHAQIESSWRSRASATWAAAAVLGPAAGSAPDVAATPGGNAVAVWIGPRGNVLAALRPVATGRWLAAAGLSAAGASAGDPRIVPSGVGGAVAVWSRAALSAQIVESSDLAGTGPLLTDVVIPARGTARTRVSFHATPVPWAAALAGQTVWSFGDGSSGKGVRLTHVYGAPGRYTVTVKQADQTGSSAMVEGRLELDAPTLRNVVRPSILGQSRVGAALTCNPGKWEGTPPIRLAFSWLRGGRPIVGQKARRYRAQPVDVGSLVACRVVAIGPAGSTAATSRARRIGGVP